MVQRTPGSFEFLTGAALWSEPPEATLSAPAVRMSSATRADPRSPEQRLEVLLEQTARMQRLTAHLSSTFRLTDVAAVVVDEGTQAVHAATGALWRLDEAAAQLVLVRAVNYPPDVLAAIQRIPLTPHVPIADAVLRRETVILSSKADYEARYPTSASRTREMTAPSDYSVVALPIVVDSVARGVLALTFAGERSFDADERTFLDGIGLHCAQGFERARLYEAAVLAHERALFLSKASALLGGSLDYEETLRNVASLAVPTMGDWCGVELVDEDGTAKQVAVAHVDPAKVAFARELRDKYPTDPDAPTGVPRILRTGVSELYEDIPDALLEASAKDEEHLRIMRELGLRSAMSVPIKDRGKVVGVISFILSTGERRYTQDDLLMAEQLGERAGAAIGNALLYKQARDAVRIRDEFMLVAGHELRTPLSALSLHHEALTNTRDDTPLQKVRERGVKLKAQTDRLARLIEELLDVSRISAGRLSLDVEDVDLDVLLREAADRMRVELERARSQLHLETEPVRGRWDRGRLDQVITNLLSNAVKYARGKPVTACVRMHEGAAQIIVKDEGIGIAPADQARIFERFERAVPSRKYGGLGLGLWITSRLVASHGGTITVESSLGAGATFTVTLPLVAPV